MAPLWAQDNVTASTFTVYDSTAHVKITPPEYYAPIENNAFRPGEKFSYKLKYQFITAGSATLEIGEGPKFGDRTTYQIESYAKSTKFIDAFFKVRDYNASLVDTASMASLSFHQNLKEGKYKITRNTKRDYLGQKYSYERIYKGRTTLRVGPLVDVSNDILSSFFYARLLPLKLGQTYFVRVFSDGKYYQLRIDVYKKLKKVRVPAGKFECIVIRPHVVGDAIFKAKDGKMKIWLTNDNRRMPVLIRSKVFIGAFDAELTSFEGDYYPKVEEVITE